MGFGGLGDYIGHLVSERFHHTAAQHDDFRTEDVDQIRNADANVLGRLLDDLADEFVAATNRLPQIPAAQVFQTIAQHLGQESLFAILHARLDALKDRRAAGHRLETPFVPAAALRPVDVNDHVADLARGVIEAAVKLAVHNQSAADARAYKNADHAPRRIDCE